MKKMGHYILYLVIGNFGKVTGCDAYNPCNITADARPSDCIMMIPGTYAEMHNDYD